MFLPPPLKSSAAMRAASTEPMPLVSWKMPEMSLSTPTRTTLSEISRAPRSTSRKSQQRQTELKPFIVFSLDCAIRTCRAILESRLPVRQPQHQAVEIGVILIWHDSRLLA